MFNRKFLPKPKEFRDEERTNKVAKVLALSSLVDFKSHQILTFIVGPALLVIPVNMRSFWACCVAATTAVSAVSAAGYVHDEGWPHGMPGKATQLSAVGVDPYVLGGTEIYIAQRGPNVSEPILVFNEAGELLRSFGSSNIERDAQSGSWGCHGLSVKSSPTKPTQIWINDFVEFTTKVFTAEGKLITTLGTKDDGGADVSPIQFDKVADTAFGADDTVYVSDGDGSSNHRVVAIDGSNLHALGSRAKHGQFRGSQASADPILWVGGNNNTDGAFSDTVYGLSLQSMHSVAYHSRTNTLFAIDRENNRTLHADAVRAGVTLLLVACVPIFTLCLNIRNRETSRAPGRCLTSSPTSRHRLDLKRFTVCAHFTPKSTYSLQIDVHL